MAIFTGLLVVSIAVLAWRLARRAFHLSELANFIPIGLILVWMVFNSAVPMKQVYVINGLHCIVPLAIAFLFNYVVTGVGSRWLAAAGFVAIGGFFTWIGFVQLREVMFPRRPPSVLEVEYKLVRGLPTSQVHVFATNDATGSRVGRYCTYYVQGSGKSAPRMRTPQQLIAAVDERQADLYACMQIDSVEAPAPDSEFVMSAHEIYRNPANGVMIVRFAKTPAEK